MGCGPEALVVSLAVSLAVLRLRATECFLVMELGSERTVLGVVQQILSHIGQGEVEITVFGNSQQATA